MGAFVWSPIMPRYTNFSDNYMPEHGSFCSVNMHLREADGRALSHHCGCWVARGGPISRRCGRAPHWRTHLMGKHPLQ